MGSQKKKAGLLFSLKIVLKGENIGELSTVVRKHHGHKDRKRKTACSQSSFDLLELQGSLHSRLVFEQKPEHEIERSEVDGEDDFAARNSDNGIKLRMCAKPFPCHMSEEIRIGAFLLYGRRNDIRPLLFARLELYGAWKVNLGSRIISLGKMPINRAERHIEIRVRSDDMINVLPLLNAGGNDAILLVKRRTVQRNAFACIVQERFVFGMCLRSDIEKAEEAAVSGTALGAGVADEGRLVEQGAELSVCTNALRCSLRCRFTS